LSKGKRPQPMDFILGCALADAFTHRFIKGLRVGMQMPRPRFSPGEGSKQPQVSALPERRVKKQRQTALMGYFRSSRGLLFCCRVVPGDICCRLLAMETPPVQNGRRCRQCLQPIATAFMRWKGRPCRMGDLSVLCAEYVSIQLTDAVFRLFLKRKTAAFCRWNWVFA